MEGSLYTAKQLVVDHPCFLDASKHLELSLQLLLGGIVALAGKHSPYQTLKGLVVIFLNREAVERDGQTHEIKVSANM